MKDMIRRTATAIGVGASVEGIYELLKEEGLTDYQAWLTYKAALFFVPKPEKPTAKMPRVK